jgi:hypothetical protein
MPKTLQQKLAVLPGRRNILVSAPSTAVPAIGLPARAYADRLNGRFDYIHLFTTQRGDLNARLPGLKRHLKQRGSLWVSWPKAGKQGTDLTLKEVIRLAYEAGLVESKTLAFDDTWSAMKLTFPKDGKVYRNKYGRLPSATG